MPNCLYALLTHTHMYIPPPLSMFNCEDYEDWFTWPNESYRKLQENKRCFSLLKKKKVSSLLGACEKPPCHPWAGKPLMSPAPLPELAAAQNRTPYPPRPLRPSPCPALQAFPLIQSPSGVPQLNTRPSAMLCLSQLEHMLPVRLRDSLSCHMKTAWEPSSGGLIIAGFIFETLDKCELIKPPLSPPKFWAFAWWTPSSTPLKLLQEEISWDQKDLFWVL